MFKSHVTWRDARKVQPQRCTSILIIDGCGNIRRGLVDKDGSVYSTCIYDAYVRFEAHLIHYDWKDIEHWTYTDELEKQFRDRNEIVAAIRKSHIEEISAKKNTADNCHLNRKEKGKMKKKRLCILRRIIAMKK